MFAALQDYLSSNQFGKSYSEIDREEQAELELQAQDSTAPSPRDKVNRLFDKEPDSQKQGAANDDILDNSAEHKKQQQFEALQFKSTAYDIISETSSCHYTAASQSQATSIRPISIR